MSAGRTAAVAQSSRAHSPRQSEILWLVTLEMPISGKGRTLSQLELMATDNESWLAF